MGAWSHTSFGNDAAMDFLSDVESGGIPAIEQALSVIKREPADGYIDSWDACAVLASGELLATACGRPPSEDFPELARQVSAHLKPDAGLQARLAAAIARILEASELRDLWEGSDYFAEWQADVNGLLERLK